MEIEQGMESLDVKFHWMPKSVTLYQRIGGELVANEKVVISLKNNYTKLVIPHPITGFLRAKYVSKGACYHTQLKAARVICKFLNFVYSNIEDDVEGYKELWSMGLRGLQRKHGGDFITDLTYKGVSFNRAVYCEQTLTNFFAYLKENDLIDEEFQMMYRTVGKKIERPLSVFSKSNMEVSRPNRNKTNTRDKLKDFGPNRYRLAYEFIEEAEAFGIALGVCFQFLSGLRVGEVVNLMRDSIYENGFRGNGGMWLDIRDNQDILFRHLNSKYDVQVKRPRETMVLDDQKLWEVYYAHMAQLEKIKRKFKDKDTGALFISKKSGLPISGTGYAKKFVKIKERFLAKLIANNRYEDIEFLTSAEWSTHIGRGVYTNFLIDLGLSIEEIANLRGDKSLTATLEYVEKRTSLSKVQSHINFLSTVYGEARSEEEIIEERKTDRGSLYIWRGLKNGWTIY